MENKDFTLTIKTVWLLVASTFLFTVIAFFAAVYQWEYKQIFTTLSLMMFFASWVIIFNDMVQHKIYNKPFWMLSMFTLPHLSIFFYTIQRNKLLRLGQKLAS
ncbi:MAG: hypothetical protein PWP52_1396 [Bacteroidales bacterium]|jgi:heme O synthase-like polyprenyltransferase|nr:hypothetical protein [Bacteroidales bacterium]